MTDKADFDAALARLVRLAQARDLPGLATQAEGDEPRLTVAGNAFLHLVEPQVVALHCPVEQKVLLIEISPDIYFETDHHVGKDTLLVRLDRIDDEELSLRLHDAWTFRAPDHLKRD